MKHFGLTDTVDGCAVPPAEGNDFLESSTWPIRSMHIVALLELEDFSKARFS